MIKLMLITNNPEMAQFAIKWGVDRIFIDLETLGKKERQGHLNTLISEHSIQDIRPMRLSVPGNELLVRLNPYHDGTKDEIETAVSAGADFLMLPMFTQVEEVRHFCVLVDGRAKVIPLVETPRAVTILPDLVKIPGVSEVYIGLNDLHIGLKLDFMFEPLVNGMLDEMVQIIKRAGLPFGFGGIARVGEGLLPGEMVLAEHVRLGSSSVILSRTFHRQSQGVGESQSYMDFEEEIRKLRDAEHLLKRRTAEDEQHDHHIVTQIVAEVVQQKLRGRSDETTV